MYKATTSEQCVIIFRGHSRGCVLYLILKEFAECKLQRHFLPIPIFSPIHRNRKKSVLDLLCLEKKGTKRSTTPLMSLIDKFLQTGKRALNAIMY